GRACADHPGVPQPFIDALAVHSYGRMLVGLTCPCCLAVAPSRPATWQTANSDPVLCCRGWADLSSRSAKADCRPGDHGRGHAVARAPAARHVRDGRDGPGGLGDLGDLGDLGGPDARAVADGPLSVRTCRRRSLRTP